MKKGIIITLILWHGGDPREPGDPRGKPCANDRNRNPGSVRKAAGACYHHPELG